MSVMFISIFFLPFGAILVALAIAALAQRLIGAGRAAPAPATRRSGSAFAGLAIAGAVVAVVIVLTVTGLVVSQRDVEVKSEARIEAPVATPTTPMPAASYEWNAAMSRDPTAPRDPHTSMTTVKAYMAASLETSLARVGEGARKVWVVADEKIRDDQTADEKVPTELVTNLLRELKAQVPKSAKDMTDVDAVVRLRWEDGPNTLRVPWWPEPMRRGTLVADVTAPRGEDSIKARLEEKPWLGPTPVRLGQRDYVVVTSGGPTAPTREEAVYRLDQRRTTAVSNMVEPQVAALASQWHARSEDVRTQVLARYGDTRTPFDDQVVMRIDRPLGPVWYAAGLVRVQESEISRMAQAAQSVSYDRRAGWAQMIGGAVGMMLVLLVLYGIMNAITRGYFRAHLRTAVAIMLALAVVVMFLRMA